MTDTKFLGVSAMVVAFLIAAAIVLGGTQQVIASAPSGLSAQVATTSTLTFAAGETLTMVATSSCSARIVSTGSSGIMLTFSNYANQAPTGSFGNWQGPSTTVAYDSGVYGCGLVKAKTMSAQTVQITDVR